MIFEFNYVDRKASDLRRLNRLQPEDGEDVQDLLLYDTDESQLTKRERFIMTLSAISYEVDHGMLTDRLRRELGIYHRWMQEGRFNGLLGDNEEAAIRADLEKYYDLIFGK